jgi:hypothetical protein
MKEKNKNYSERKKIVIVYIKLTRLCFYVDSQGLIMIYMIIIAFEIHNLMDYNRKTSSISPSK